VTKLEKVEKDIQSLSADDLARFREWFADFDAANWDAKIERDVEGRRLDFLGENALKAHRSKQTQKL
jgi:hypothetical protein